VSGPIPALSQPVVLFVGGYARSGSTVMDILLGTAAGFCSAGELRFIWRRGFLEDQSCACGAAFSRCPFWDRVFDLGFGGRAAVDVDAVLRWNTRVDRWWRIPQLLARRSTGIARDLDAYRTTMRRLYTGIAAASGSRVIVDSSKDASHGYVLRALGPTIDLRVVHLVRDGRAVAYSLCERRKFDPASGRVIGGHSHLHAAAGWSATNLLVEGLRVASDRPYLRVRYEACASEPERVLRRIVAFAGGDPRSVTLNTSSFQLGADHHTVAGNPMRFERGEVPIRPDEVWRTQMSRKGRTTVEALTWPLLVRYGRSTA
jgi:hypothetical protein